MRVLIIDDDVRLHELLASYLDQNGIHVTVAADGQKGLAALDGTVFDAVLLDVMMPGMDGLEVAKRIRAKSTIPVIMLTAKGDETDRVVGLELGADDYITKPFSIREFRSRVRALLRRARAPRQDPELREEQLAAGGLVLDAGRRTVSSNGAPVQLTYVEFEILRTLMGHPGRVYSRRMLLEVLWGSSDFRDPRTIDVHVRHLREKLEPDSSRPEYILTVRSVGYRFRDP